LTLYLRSADVSVSGSRFNTRASPSLAHLVRQAAEEIPHPTSKDDAATLWDATNDIGTLFGNRGGCQNILDADVVSVNEEENQHSSDLGVRPLGSGSDYTVFLQHIGVCSNLF